MVHNNNGGELKSIIMYYPDENLSERREKHTPTVTNIEY